MPEWDAEIEVDETLARRLIARQFPQLDLTWIDRLGEGWDNTVWVTADGVAFRFPRREIAIPGVRRELAILPELAPRLPATIPDAAYVGVADELFPWPWFGSRLIEGTEIALAPLPGRDRPRFAAELGSFLRSLHALGLPSATQLPIDPLGRADMTLRVARTREALAALPADWGGHERAEAVLVQAQGLAASGESVLVHGDLNVRHVLVSGTGHMSGVIDWGDIARGPRSIDLPLYWSLFTPSARVAFRRAYGPLDDETLLRARVLALFLDAILVVYAEERGMRELAAETRRGLGRTLVD